MGNKNYTKYSEKSNNNKPMINKELEETVLNTGGEVITTDPELPEVNEGVNNNITPEVPEIKEDNNNTEPQNENVEKGDAKLVGVVTGCEKLNVRKEPNKESDVLCVINKNEVVEFDTEEYQTYEDFYKIVTTTGVKGYCMKQFIKIK